jgi:hypothetical protein
MPERGYRILLHTPEEDGVDPLVIERKKKERERERERDTGVPVDIEDPNDQPFDDERQEEWKKQHTPEPDTAPRGSEDVTDWGKI